MIEFVGRMRRRYLLLGNSRGEDGLDGVHVDRQGISLGDKRLLGCDASKHAIEDL
jgi:hypothetical protein